MNLKLTLLVSTISLAACTKLTTEDVNEVQHRLAYVAIEKYLSKYDIKDNEGRVYNYKNNKFSIDREIEAITDKCEREIEIGIKDIEKVKSYPNDYHNIKKDINVDYRKFNKCVNDNLKKFPLTYSQLEAFSNDQEIQEYKKKYDFISAQIEKAKSDRVINLLEALDIYLLVYKQKEKDLFNGI